MEATAIAVDSEWTQPLIDLPTVSIAVMAFAFLSFKKIPEPFLILAAGVAGLLLFKG